MWGLHPSLNSNLYHYVAQSRLYQIRIASYRGFLLLREPWRSPAFSFEIDLNKLLYHLFRSLCSLVSK